MRCFCHLTIVGLLLLVAGCQSPEAPDNTPPEMPVALGKMTLPKPPAYRPQPAKTAEVKVVATESNQLEIAAAVIQPPVSVPVTNIPVTNAPATNAPATNAPAKLAPPMLGLQLAIQGADAANELAEAMPKLAALGINVIILEIDYHFDFKSHPELRTAKFITRADARRLAVVARQNGVRLIPELDCLGHQSLKKSTLAFLSKYPELAEPSPSSPDPKTDYLKAWCPSNPRVNPIIFDLIDEIAAAFDADAFHVGMDEVFNMSSDNCPLCRGQDRATLFARQVNDLYKHIAIDKKMEMFMWGDRLLDAGKTGYSQWEASRIGTARAIDLISTNIVICDWHYGTRDVYPSVPLFLQKGFRVWPSGFRPLESSKAFSDYARRERQITPRLIGYLCTTWSLGKPKTVGDWPPVVEILKDWKNQDPTTRPNQ